MTLKMLLRIFDLKLVFPPYFVMTWPRVISSVCLTLRGNVKPRGAQRSTEVRANWLFEVRAKSARVWNDVQSHFSRSLYWEKLFEICFGGPLGVYKRILNKKELCIKLTYISFGNGGGRPRAYNNLGDRYTHSNLTHTFKQMDSN